MRADLASQYASDAGMSGADPNDLGTGLAGIAYALLALADAVESASERIAEAIEGSGGDMSRDMNH